MNDRKNEFLFLLGTLYLRNNQVDKAVIVLEALRVLERDNQRVVGSLAYGYLSASRFHDCLQLIDSTANISTSIGRETVQLVRSRALWGLGQQEEARRVLQEANHK